MDETQIKVAKWIMNDLNFPIFADSYKGAIEQLHSKQSGYVSFVSHACRDIMNSLAREAHGLTTGRVQYKQHVDRIQNSWLDEWSKRDDLSPEQQIQGHFIPLDVCQEITELLDVHQQGSQRAENVDTLFFRYFLKYEDRSLIPPQYLKQWKSSKDWFLAHAHSRTKPYDEDVHTQLEEHFCLLDSYLRIAAASQHDSLRILDAILDQANT